MANKVMSLHDAVEKYVHDNDVLCLGGFTTNRKPYAAVYEILRQGKNWFCRLVRPGRRRLGLLNR